uniref:Uncharacterized protein n=1 Tax=Amphimedon queenslandica TaxID=400682 RepID=A0A1X7T7G2_AMPQE
SVHQNQDWSLITCKKHSKKHKCARIAQHHVSCETDFNFIQFMSEAARAAADHLKYNPPSDPQQHLKPEDLASFRGPGGNSLGDMTAKK